MDEPKRKHINRGIGRGGFRPGGGRPKGSKDKKPRLSPGQGAARHALTYALKRIGQENPDQATVDAAVAAILPICEVSNLRVHPQMAGPVINAGKFLVECLLGERAQKVEHSGAVICVVNPYATKPPEGSGG